ncbi:MAG TPA: glycosyltransferase family 2 protein, partial [Longimicrobiales bacterium]
MQAETQPLVSIITPVYNAERYIARCINSVLAQSYGRWEQLIVDDGSTDATAAVIATFNDPRIRYFRLPHRGLARLAESYNHALGAAIGGLVAVLEGDDFWPSDKLAVQTQVFEQHDVMLSWGRALTVDDADRVLGWWRQPSEGQPDGRMQLASLFKLLTRKNPLTPAATVMARRSALDAIGGFHQAPDTFFVDFPTWLQLSSRVDGSAVYLRQCLAYYRVHQQQTSH